MIGARTWWWAGVVRLQPDDGVGCKGSSEGSHRDCNLDRAAVMGLSKVPPKMRVCDMLSDRKLRTWSKRREDKYSHIFRRGGSTNWHGKKERNERINYCYYFLREKPQLKTYVAGKINVFWWVVIMRWDKWVPCQLNLFNESTVGLLQWRVEKLWQSLRQYLKDFLCEWRHHYFKG